MEMKRVLSIVLSQVELRSAARRDERARRGAISFSPDQSGLVIAEPRHNGRPDTSALAAA
jgi:hypothetical protein